MILKMLSFVIILTVMLCTSLSELDMWYTDGPCTEAKDQNAYDTFLNHHLRKDVPKDRKKGEWQKFLKKINSWDRPTQSFFPFSEASRVIAVCSSEGKMYEGNLCISKKTLTFFTVKINKRKKKVKKISVQEQHVVLDCVEIKNKCVPIHFEENIKDAIPDNNKPDCGKSVGKYKLYSSF